jgi:probable rRNA maturation factor
MLYIEMTETVSASNTIKKAAKKSAKAAAKLENKKGSVSLLFTGDDNIRQLNKQYRGKDAVTDVLSFPSGEEGFLGDIALCLPRAYEQAEEFGHSSEREVAFLVAHSMLHLFGYDHDSEEGERAMRERQREIMKTAGYEI